jgi:hypothetical protein
MDMASISGKRLALWLTDDCDESAVFTGEVRWDGTMLTLDRGSEPAFEVRPEWYCRIKAVSDDDVSRILLNSDYYLRLWVGKLPDAANDAEYEKTGLKWPE